MECPNCHRNIAFCPCTEQQVFDAMDPTEEFVLSEEQAAAIDGAYHDTIREMGG